MNSLIVMLGGAVGALARYHLGRTAVALCGPAFPYGTWIANVAGGLAMGLLAGWLARLPSGGGEAARLLLGVGVLGGFTTFSAFSLETVQMIGRGQGALAALYVVSSVAAAILAVMAGMQIARGIA